MFNSFLQEHPWLSKKIKKQYWKLLSNSGITSYTLRLNETNLRIIVNPKDDSVGKLIFFENYETRTLKFISKYIIPGDKVIDIGANIGYFTLLFSSYVGDEGEVHSFEPSTREFLHLCRNIEINHKENIFLNQFALSNINGYGVMNILNDARFGAYNSIRQITHRKVVLEESHYETVRTIKLDDYLSLLPSLAPSLIKIDVEGHEINVVEGMQTLLNGQAAPCLVIEICEGTHVGDQIGSLELINLINRMGYTLYSPDEQGNLLPFEIGETLNGIAIKPSHFERLNIKEIKIAPFS